MTQPTFYLTTPIYYVNAQPHLGHAYTTILADAMCRYHRLAGERVYFLTGTDEHGDKIAQAAAQAGVSPQAYADQISAVYRRTWQALGISNDDFIRTTEPRHQKVVQDILQRLYDAGEIYFGEYGGNYCFGCERFYTEREIVDGKCPDHQTPLTFIKEKNYFFRMSKYQEWLIAHLEAHPGFIQPERYRNEVLGFLREPLQDLSISRPRSRLEWGIPLPFDEQYVTYVWFDALINYYSAVSDPSNATQGLWDHVEHVIGKDILKPHGVYWPTMLKAAGLPIYRRLNVHGYWTVDGQKMSKSLGNVVEPLPMQEKYGEAFRYFLLRESVFGLDSDFSERALVTRLNSDLANDLGNLVSRATTLIAGFDGGRLPAPGPHTPADDAVREGWQRVRDDVAAAMHEFAFQRALAAIWEFIGVLNRYVDAEQPWALAKDPARRPRLQSVLYTLGQSLRVVGSILDPFLPEAAAKIRRAVGGPETVRLDQAEWGKLAAGTRIEKLTGLFPRVEVKKVSPPAAAAPAPDRIPIGDFAKVELRVAEVVSAEKVAKSKKLLKLTVDTGTETRTLVAGIAEHYDPADLVGRKVVIVANLEPATLMGIESNGMVLAASQGATLSLLTLDKDIPPGSKVT